MVRYRSRGRSVEVECLGEAYIDDFETDVLVEELKRRKHQEKVEDPDNDIVLALEAMKEGRHEDAEILLERYLWPRFRSVEHCQKVFDEMKGPH